MQPDLHNRENQPNMIMPRLQGAAANLLDAAQIYGKLDKTAGVGSYVEKAENYLREYETS